MSQLRHNYIFLLGSRGETSTSVARKVGVSQSTLHRLEKGTNQKPSGETLHKLASFFGVTVDALLTKDLSVKPTVAPPVQENVREGPDIAGVVPLLTSVQAGEWCDIAHAFQQEDAQDWIPCPVKHGPRTFCLIVEGESMKNPGVKPSYEPGDIIFVDPDRVASPGDRVVARLENQPAATFKQYWEEDGRRMLKALNPDWKPRYSTISDEAVICGVVIGKWVPE